MNKGTIAIIISIIIGFSVVFSTLILGNSIKSIKENKTISVTGSAQMSITADYATWTGSFSATAPVQKDAFSIISNNQKAVLEFIKSLGVKEEEISFSSVDSSPIYKKSQYSDYATTNEIEYYRLSQTVSIKSSDVALINSVSTRATDLIAQGIDFSSYRPEFYCKDLSNIKIEMIGKATKDCKNRAEQIVSNAGGSLGNIISANTGVFQITPENSTEVSDYGINDTSAINKQITAVVKCTFSVE